MYCRNIFRETDTVYTQGKTGIVAYFGVVYTFCVGNGIMIAYVTGIMSNIQSKDAI